MSPVLLLLLSAAAAAFSVAMALQRRAAARRMQREDLRLRLRAPEAHAEAVAATGAWGRLLQLLAASGLGWSQATLRRNLLLGAGVGALLGAWGGEAVLGVLGALLGAAAPVARLQRARGKRLDACNQQFPQALQLMMLALRAGHALPGALALASREAPLPLRTELAAAVDAHALGIPLGEVFLRLAGRLERCDAARTLAVAVNVLERTGGNLIHILEGIVENARARTQYESRLRALTAQGRWSALILAVLTPFFFLAAGVVDERYWPTLFADATGWSVFAIATAMWGAGVLWTYRLVGGANGAEAGR